MAERPDGAQENPPSEENRRRRERAREDRALRRAREATPDVLEGGSGSEN